MMSPATTGTMIPPGTMASTSSSMITTSVHQSRGDTGMMFPTTLEHRPIIKGVRSLNRNSHNNPSSPEAKQGKKTTSCKSSHGGMATGFSSSHQVSKDVVKQEGISLPNLDSGPSPMDVEDSLNLIQSLLSIEPGSSSVCEHHATGGLDLASLFTHGPHHHHHQPVAGGSGVDSNLFRPSTSHLVLQNNSQVEQKLDTFQSPSTPAASHVAPTTADTAGHVISGPGGHVTSGPGGHVTSGSGGHVISPASQHAGATDQHNISMMSMKPIFQLPTSTPSTLPSTAAYTNPTQIILINQKNQGESFVLKKEEVSPRPSPQCTPRPSPQSTPPPVVFVDQSNSGTFVRGSDSRSFKRSGRSTPTGKRSRPQTPTNYASDGEMSDGGCSVASSGYHSGHQSRDRRESGGGVGATVGANARGAGASGGASARVPNFSQEVKFEDKEDEDKYNKRKKQGEASGRKDSGGKRDPIKLMLEELQSCIPHIGNPHEEKVSHAGLLLEGSDYIRSLKQESKTLQDNIETMRARIEDLNKEIEESQDKLPEHGSQSIHKILSTKGKSIPDMFADHVRHRTQEDWRYWVFTSIMGHFVHTFAQEVSNISPREMERTCHEWLQERMSLQQLRKDAFRKLAKLCSKTSIMEDATRLPEEARGFVALPAPDSGSKEETEELDPPAFRNNF